jgi:hypothetical protein
MELKTATGSLSGGISGMEIRFQPGVSETSAASKDLAAEL